MKRLANAQLGAISKQAESQSGWISSTANIVMFPRASENHVDTSNPSGSHISSPPMLATAQNNVEANITHSSRSLATQIRSLLEILSQQLHSQPDLKCIVQSVKIASQKMQQRTITYERLLPKLRNLVEKQQRRLLSSSAVLEQSRQAQLVLQRELAAARKVTLSHLDERYNAAGRRHSTSEITSKTSKAELLHKPPTSEQSSEVSEYRQRLQLSEDRARKLAAKVRDLELRCHEFQSERHRHGASVRSLHERVQFQSRVNKSLQRVILKQEQLLRSVGLSQHNRAVDVETTVDNSERPIVGGPHQDARSVKDNDDAEDDESVNRLVITDEEEENQDNDTNEDDYLDQYYCNDDDNTEDTNIQYCQHVATDELLTASVSRIADSHDRLSTENNSNTRRIGRPPLPPK